MKSPGLAKDRADRRSRIKQRSDIGIILRSAFDAAGRSKCSDERILPIHIAGTFKEFNILGIGTGPASFDKSNAKFIQLFGDANLVITRERKAFRLRPVAEGGVVYLYIHSQFLESSSCSLFSNF